MATTCETCQEANTHSHPQLCATCHSEDLFDTLEMDLELLTLRHHEVGTTKLGAYLAEVAAKHALAMYLSTL